MLWRKSRAKAMRSEFCLPGPCACLLSSMFCLGSPPELESSECLRAESSGSTGLTSPVAHCLMSEVDSYVFVQFSSFFMVGGLVWYQDSLMAQTIKHLPAMQETWVRSLGQEDPLEKETATHSNTLVWKIPRTEEAGGLQSMGSQRVGHN